MTEHIKIYGVKPRIQYVSDGTLQTYEFPFAVFDKSNVEVYLDDIKQEENSYQVHLTSTGGTITFNIQPANKQVITIVRNLSIERTSDFQDGGVLRANTLNDEFDYQIACLQQVADHLNRSMVMPPYAVDSKVDLTLPTPSAGKAIVWNSDGTNLENSAVKVNELESTLKGYKESAEQSSMMAEESAKSALQQADIATEQAQIATEKAQETIATLASKANQDMDNLSLIGKEQIAHLAMPSENYIELVAEQNATYTAPANGYFVASFTGSGTHYCFIINQASTMGSSYQFGYNSGITHAINCPVSKGQTVVLNYDCNMQHFRFIYAQGEI